MIILDKIGSRAGMDSYNLAFGEALSEYYDINIACSSATVITNNSIQKNVYGKILNENNSSLLNLFLNCIGLYKVLRMKRSDSYVVINVFNFDLILVLDFIVFKIFSRKIILIVHDYESLTGRKNYMWLKSYCIKKAKYLFVHNSALVDTIKRDFSVQAHQFNHGVVKPSFRLSHEFSYLNVDSNVFNILFFGTIKKSKGFDVLIEALTRIKETKFNLIVAGKVDKDYLDTFKKIIRTDFNHNLQLFDRFITNDERDYFFKTANLVIIPYRESFQSGVLLMSLAYSKPLICNDLPAFSHILNALPFIPKYTLNDPSSLARNIVSEFNASSFNDKNFKKIDEHLTANYYWPEIVSRIYTEVLFKDLQNISVIGTVGLPACYGGFESLVENLVENSNLSYYVYCQSSQYTKKVKRYKSATLIYLPFKANGIQSIFYDSVSIIHSLITTKNTLLILGVSGAAILPFVRLFTNRRIIINIDGIEWKREKWGKLAAWFLRISEGLAVRYSDVVVSDNKAISDYVHNQYHCNSSVIPYGGDHSVVSELPQKKDNFFLGLCRIEPENNVEMILKSFSINGESLKFIGNWSNNDYSRKLRLKYKKFSNIDLIDPIYDIKDLFYYRSRCKGYVHGHSAGGTNPSLVEMMHFKTPVICFDCSYNRETTENKAYYFASADELTKLVLKGFEINGFIHEIANRRYTWEFVRQQYEKLY